jgi:hypothetical protein
MDIDHLAASSKAMSRVKSKEWHPKSNGHTRGQHLHSIHWSIHGHKLKIMIEDCFATVKRRSFLFICRWTKCVFTIHSTIYIHACSNKRNCSSILRVHFNINIYIKETNHVMWWPVCITHASSGSANTFVGEIKGHARFASKLFGKGWKPNHGAWSGFLWSTS